MGLLRWSVATLTVLFLLYNFLLWIASSARPASRHSSPPPPTDPSWNVALVTALVGLLSILLCRHSVADVFDALGLEAVADALLALPDLSLDDDDDDGRGSAAIAPRRGARTVRGAGQNPDGGFFSSLCPFWGPRGSPDIAGEPRTPASASSSAPRVHEVSREEYEASLPDSWLLFHPTRGLETMGERRRRLQANSSSSTVTAGRPESLERPEHPERPESLERAD